MHLKTQMQMRHCAAAFAGGIALIALLGWAAAHLGSADPTPGFGAANPMTSIACVLIALALMLPPRRPTFLLAILTIAVISVGAAKLVQLLLGLPVGIDQLLFADRLAGAGNLPTGDMPAGVGLALTLLGGALLAGPSCQRCAGLASHFLCAVVMAIALLAAAGHGLDGLGLDGVVRVRMPLDSALAFMALAIGVASIRSDAGMMPHLLDRAVAGLTARSALPFARPAILFMGEEDGTALVTSAMPAPSN